MEKNGWIIWVLIIFVILTLVNLTISSFILVKLISGSNKILLNPIPSSSIRAWLGFGDNQIAPDCDQLEDDCNTACAEICGIPDGVGPPTDEQQECIDNCMEPFGGKAPEECINWWTQCSPTPDIA